MSPHKDTNVCQHKTTAKLDQTAPKWLKPPSKEAGPEPNPTRGRLYRHHLGPAQTGTQPVAAAAQTPQIRVVVVMIQIMNEIILANLDTTYV